MPVVKRERDMHLVALQNFRPLESVASVTKGLNRRSLPPDSATYLLVKHNKRGKSNNRI